MAVARSSPRGGPGAARSSLPEPGPGRLRRLRKRPEFLRVAKGWRRATPAFVLQVAWRDDDPVIGIGFTASKKVGNAVARNRARRRLREVARRVLPDHGLVGCDHVLVARQGAVAYPFAALTTDLIEALAMARTGLR